MRAGKIVGMIFILLLLGARAAQAQASSASTATNQSAVAQNPDAGNADACFA